MKSWLTQKVDPWGTVRQVAIVAAALCLGWVSAWAVYGMVDAGRYDEYGYEVVE